MHPNRKAVRGFSTSVIRSLSISPSYPTGPQDGYETFYHPLPDNLSDWISHERSLKDGRRDAAYGGAGRPAILGWCCCLRWSLNNSRGGWGTGATLEALSFISSNKLASLLPTNYLINSIIVTECTWLITLFTSTLMVADYLLQDLRGIRNGS